MQVDKNDVAMLRGPVVPPFSFKYVTSRRSGYLRSSSLRRSPGGLSKDLQGTPNQRQEIKHLCQEDNHRGVVISGLANGE